MSVYDEEKQTENTPDNSVDDSNESTIGTPSPADIAEKETSETDSSDSGDFSKEKSSIAGAVPANSLYKQNIKMLADQATGKFGKKGAIGLGAGLLLTLVIAMGSIFSFLNLFKLDNLVQNIDQKAYARFIGASDRRTDKWVAAYIAVRLGEIEDPKKTPGERKNIFFQANGVDTNSPFTDWYRTMRVSKFEQDVFEKNGIKFVTVLQPDGSIRAGAVGLKFNDKKNDVRWGINLSDADRAALKSGDLTALNNFQNRVDTTIFQNDKDARLAIKKYVNDNTHSWQMIKRRHIRKDLQNVNGVRDWRFFERTRDKIDAKKIDMRNKLVTWVFPEDTNSGKFVRCLFGITDCSKATNDPSAPENKAEARPIDANQADQNKDPAKSTSTTNPDGSTKTTTENLGTKTDAALLSDITKKLLEKVNPALNVANVVGMLDQFAAVDKAVSTGTAAKLVSLARGQQASALYTALAISRDQLRTGQVTPEEVSGFMKIWNSASNSEGWATVIAGKSGAKAEGLTPAKTKTEYCDPAYQAKLLEPQNADAANKQYAWLCGDKKIGGESNAQELTTMYNQTIGVILHPIAVAYTSVESLPVVSFFHGIITGISDLFGSAINAIMQPILSGLGVQGTIENFMGWLTGKVLQFMGGGPMFTGNEPDGQFANVAIEGAVYNAEASGRSNGAAETTPETKVTALQTYSNYQQNNSPSLAQKYIALSNPDSLASKSMFAVANNINSSPAVNISKVVTNFGSIVTSPFSKKTYAATSPYAGADFSGVDTYDFPDQCYNLSPTENDPNKVTNAIAVLNKYRISTAEFNLTWDLVTNNDAWYNALYSVIGDPPNVDAGDVAKQIYNCALLDTTVRGGLGAIYGYTKDNGYSDSPATQPNVASNNNIYVVGDSLTQGMSGEGNLSQKLTDKGWQSTISGLVSRRLIDGVTPTGIEQIQNDQAVVSQAGAIVVELGTNNAGDSSSGFTAELDKFYKQLRTENPNASVYWVNYVGTGSFATSLAARTKDLEAFAAKNNITIIDWASIGGPLITSGGVHPSGNYDKLADLVVSAVGTPLINSAGVGSGNLGTNTSIKYPNVDKAVANALNIPWVISKACGGDCYHLCDHITAVIWGRSAWGYGSAMLHWQAMKTLGKAHPGDTNPPVGAILFWDTGIPEGHATFYLGNNKLTTNDFQGHGSYSVENVDALASKWNAQYLGWADPYPFGGLQ